jgi:hypothetical protein
MNLILTKQYFSNRPISCEALERQFDDIQILCVQNVQKTWSDKTECNQRCGENQILSRPGPRDSSHLLPKVISFSKILSVRCIPNASKIDV